MIVIKRDGSQEELNLRKIYSAIEKAFDACCPDENKEVITSMVTDMHLWDGITIEEIQNIVIETLRDYDFDRVADRYQAYKDAQSRYREIIAKIDYQDKYVSSKENAATSSETDGNANVVSKNVATLESEDRKRENREIQRYRMKRQLKQMGPEYRPLASQYAKDIEGHEIYPHDEASTSVLKQYCMAATTYPLMIEGVGNIQDIINAMSKKYLPLSGGTMSGTLTVPIINVNSIAASDKDKFDINTVWTTNGETINLVDFIAEHGAAISSIENSDIDNIFV